MRRRHRDRIVQYSASKTALLKPLTITGIRVMEIKLSGEQEGAEEEEEEETMSEEGSQMS